MSAARERKQDLYIYQCTADTRPEDLLISPVISEAGPITYQASPLVTAMVTGSVCLLDEGNRMNEKSWASLAPLLDHRRCVESIVAGIQVRAHQDFRCCVTMNEDASTYEVPDYILSRLQPSLKVEFPNREHELAILQYHLPFAPGEILNLAVEFLQKAHQLDLGFSVRETEFILCNMPSSECLKILPIHSAVINFGKRRSSKFSARKRWTSISWPVTGLARSGEQSLPRGLGDFFFDEDSPLHPDR